MTATPADVIVIGGGAAGLAAAARLTAAGLQTVLVEARDRLGGRIDTRLDPEWPAPVERGAEFIHGRPPEIWNIVQAAGLETRELEGGRWQRADGELRLADERWQGIQAVLDRLADIGEGDLSFTEFLASRCGDLAPRDKAAAIGYVEGFEAADPRLMSAQALRKAEQASAEIEADRNFRLAGGYGQVINWLHHSADSRRLEVRLCTVVSTISWEPGHVEIESRSADGAGLASCQAARAVITLPLGVLQAEPGTPASVRFEPELPEKRAAIARLKMGSVVKIVFRFDEAFWLAGQLAEMSFLHAPGQPIPTWWTLHPLRVPILTGWAGGPAAERLAGLDEATILAHGLAALAHALDLPREPLQRRLRAWHVCNWQADPFAHGAYSYVPVGGAEAVEELARPVADTLYFAGEATQGGFGGTVASAIASGHRAANEISRSLESTPRV